MGFYGMTCSVIPLGGVDTSALTNLFAAHIALAAGGISIALFSIGPTIANSKIRNAISHLWLLPKSKSRYSQLDLSR